MESVTSNNTAHQPENGDLSPGPSQNRDSKLEWKKFDFLGEKQPKRKTQSYWESRARIQQPQPVWGHTPGAGLAVDLTIGFSRPH